MKDVGCDLDIGTVLGNLVGVTVFAGSDFFDLINASFQWRRINEAVVDFTCACDSVVTQNSRCRLLARFPL